MTQIAKCDKSRAISAGPCQQLAILSGSASNQQDATNSGSLTACTDWEGLQLHREAWVDLARRTLEPNVFADPLFLTASLQHIAATRRPVFVLTWRAGPEPGMRQLTGVFPIHIPGRMASVGTSARLWFTPMMADGAPLIDPDDPAQVLRQLSAWMAARQPHIKGIIFPALKSQGPTMRALKEAVRDTQNPLHLFDERTRAIASRELWLAGDTKSVPSSSTTKELRRLRRRLGDEGELAFVSAQTPNTIRLAMEQFLTLEAAGWKGKRGTALVCDPSTATFARALIRHFARRGRCRIDALVLNGKPVAMGIALLNKGHVSYWKTCFDEAQARFSPGSIFSLQLTDAIFENSSMESIDSCAIEKHPMIDRLWRERAEVADACLAMPHVSAASFQIHVKIGHARRSLRQRIKSVFHALTGRHAN